MEDNQSKIVIEGNVQLMSDRSYTDDEDDGLDDLESLSLLNLDLLRYIDRARIEIRQILLNIKEKPSLTLFSKLIRSMRLYLTVEEYLFPTASNSNSLSNAIPANSYNCSYLIKNLSSLLKCVVNLSNTLQFIDILINFDYDDFIKDFTWKRAEKLVKTLNFTIKNVAECLSHRMCFPKIYNGRFLPLCGGTNTLIQLCEDINEASNVTMNIAVVLFNNKYEYQSAITDIIAYWDAQLSSTNIIEKEVSHAPNTHSDSKESRIKELEAELIKTEIESFVSKYQRDVLTKYVKSINEVVAAARSEFNIEVEKFNDFRTAIQKSQHGGLHTIDYLVSPLSVPLINRNPNELAGYVTTLIKDSMELVEDKSKLMSEVSTLKAELDKERDRREAAEESCRASIDELTKHINIMESAIIEYEDKLSQIKTDR